MATLVRSCGVRRGPCCVRKGSRVRAGRVEELSTGVCVSLHLAESSDRLDLSDCGLIDIPQEVWQLQNLTELSLSGNRIQTLPDEISNLTNLQKLQLAGNELRELPEGIGALTDLRGLWAHGNFLETVPESLGELKHLEKCSLSGNQLKSLPSSFSKLSKLVEFGAAGNRLEVLPSLEGLEKLQKLELHGNALKAITEKILFCLSLRELCMQGNRLEQISSPYCFFPQQLRSLNLADNQLHTFKFDPSNLLSLEHLTLYGNQLESLPEGLMDLPKLKSIWLEGNPLNHSALLEVTKKRPIKVGLDQNHSKEMKASVGESTMISFSELPSPYRKGYFKLVKDSSNERSELLVVAFGSAPGTPNWGSALKKVQQVSQPTKAVAASPSFERSQLLDKLQKEREQQMALQFDVLFVVDPHRSWYGAADDAALTDYKSQLQQICEPYPHRLMIGDSMGATAALMFCDIATSVFAFCPQVDLQQSSIRPSLPPQKWKHLMDHIVDTVDTADADVEVVTGTWSHDIDQVKMLDREKVKHTVLHVDTHRLTAYLTQRKDLVPFLRQRVQQIFVTRTESHS